MCRSFHRDRDHLFLVKTFTRTPYLWPKMATRIPVVTSAFQLVGQKLIFPFGSDLSTLLKFDWPKYLPWSQQTSGWWTHEGQGNMILLQNIHVELQGPPCLIHVPVIHSSLVLATQLSVCLGLQVWIWMRL